MTAEEEEGSPMFTDPTTTVKVKDAVEVAGQPSSRDAVSKPAPFQHVYMRTASLYVLFCYLGMTASILGTTLVHLKVYLNEDSATLWSMALIWFSVGYLVGGLLCGILFDRYNWELLFSFSVALLSFTVGMAQLSSTFYDFLVWCTIYSVAMGYIDAAAQTYGVSLWTNRKHKEPVVQMMHVIWSAGATVGPFIIRPFLVPLPPSSVATATAVNPTTSDVTTSLFTSSPWTVDEDSSSVSIYSNSSSGGDVSVPDVSQLKYAFIIMGLIGILPTVCFIYAFFAYTPRTLSNAARVRRSRDDDQSEGQGETDAALQQTDDTDNGSRNRGNPPRSYLMLVYAVIALCFSSYLIVELTPGTLLGLFVVDGLGWEATSVSPVMSTFWGFHCLGRLVGVPVSMVLSPAPMLTINFAILFVAFCLMYAGALFSDWLVWISIAGSAFGMASTFATGVLLAAQYIPFGGTAASVVIVAASVGGAAGPPLATFLFATFGHMTFVYLLLAATSFSALSFALLYFLLRTSRSKRWTKTTTKI